MKKDDIQKIRLSYFFGDLDADIAKDMTDILN